MTPTIDPADTSLSAAQANVKANSEVEAAQYNANLKSMYLRAFDGWCVSVNAGRIPNTNPPQPPKSFVAVSLNNDGWFFPEQVGGSVCDIPPVPEDHSQTEKQRLDSLPQGVIDVGHSADQGAGTWFTVGNNDTWFKSGKKTPPTISEDGVSGLFQCVGAAVGRGWYERVG